jgi:hypothetical protein
MSQTLQTRRLIRDASLTTTIAMPNANAATYSGALDLGAPQAAFVNEKFSLFVAVPNTNIVSAKSTTLVLESADVNLNANFSTVQGGGTITITGIAGNVSAAINQEIRVPGNAQRFIRLSSTGGANSGTALTESITVRLQF